MNGIFKLMVGETNQIIIRVCCKNIRPFINQNCIIVYCLSEHVDLQYRIWYISNSYSSNPGVFWQVQGSHFHRAQPWKECWLYMNSIFHKFEFILVNTDLNWENKSGYCSIFRYNHGFKVPIPLNQIKTGYLVF